MGTPLVVGARTPFEVDADLICGLRVVVEKVATGGRDAGFVVVVFASLRSILRWWLRVFVSHASP